MRELLIERRWDITDIAAAIGVGRSTIYTWTHTAPIDKLYAIAKYTKIDIHEIIECFRPIPDPIDTAPTEIDRTGGDSN